MMKIVAPRNCEKTKISGAATLRDAIASLNNSASGIALVVQDDGRLIGVVTDGDIRRGILKGQSLDEPVSGICNRSPRYLRDGESCARAEELCLKHVVRRIPVLDADDRPVGLYYIEDFVEAGGAVARVEPKSNPVVIMAGGKGTRLDPFTRILPKPLIPIGNKAAIEVILDRFHAAGFGRFLLSVNYRKEFIKTYFTELHPLPYALHFVEEDQPLGTIGALGLMKAMLQETFIVTNCDMLLEPNWAEVLRFHKDRRFAITVLGGLRSIEVPYGVIEVEKEMFKGIREKPQYNHLVNLGVYVCEPNVPELIGANERLDATALLDRARDAGLRVGVHPILNNWHDIGQWEEYRSLLRHLEVV